MGAAAARRRPSLRLGVGLVIAAVGLVVLAASAPSTDVRPVGGAVPVNTGARDGRDVRAHNSPSVARNPSDAANLVVADRVDTPSYSCALHVSADAGRTWSESAIPFPEGEELPRSGASPPTWPSVPTASSIWPS